MQRRSFLHWSAITALSSLTRPIDSRADDELHADLVIVGGSLGGCAAALAAAKAGRTVILTEETDWIGGQLTSQAVPPDEHPWIESFGCTRSYRKLRNGIRAYYRSHYPLAAEARAADFLNPGGGSVSKLCHEPKVAFAVLTSILAPYASSGRLRILLEHLPTAAVVEGDHVKAVELKCLRTGRRATVLGKYFLDATEQGDLLPLTKTEYVTGFESQKETGEPHAPAEAQPANIQAWTWCFAIDHREGEDHTIEKPAGYDTWNEYVPEMSPPWPGKLLAWHMSHPHTLKPRPMMFDPAGSTKPGVSNLWLYRRIAAKHNFVPGAYDSDVTLVNWPQNDYWLGNLHDVSSEEKERHLRRGRELSLSLLYWMQTEAPRPDGGNGWPGLRLRGDLTEGPDGLAKAPYIRESRRIKAAFTVTELHVGREARLKRAGSEAGAITAEHFPDSVGIGSYRIDLHPSSGGDNYIDVANLPFQIPLGALIPQRMENLLPACKNLGVTHIANGCYRLHPVEWNIGESAGHLAAYCLSTNQSPRQIHSSTKRRAEFQRVLTANGVELAWPRVG